MDNAVLISTSQNEISEISIGRGHFQILATITDKLSASTDFVAVGTLEGTGMPQGVRNQ